MMRTRSFCGLAVLAGLLVAGSLGAMDARGQTATGKSPDPGVVGVRVRTGSLVVYGTDTVFLPRGFNSIGVLYPAQYATTMCSHLGSRGQQKLAAAETVMTTETDQQLLAMKEHWRANTVRYQVSQGALAYEHDHGLSAYTDMVLSVVRQARKMGLVTIVSMQTEGFSCTAHTHNGGLQKLPNHETEDAWAQLAPSLGHDRGVMLEVFNEPTSLKACGARKWKYWATGCKNGAYVGMVTLGKYLRKLAPDNVLLFDGNGLPAMFTGFPASVQSAMPANSAYVAHPYGYRRGPNAWNTEFGHLQTEGNAVVTTEWNEVLGACRQHRPQPVALAHELVQSYLPRHDIGLILHSWDAPGAALAGPLDNPVDYECSYPTGARLVYNQFWAEAGGKRPAPEVHVSSTTRIGGILDSVTVALASNGGKDGKPAPYIARSADLMVAGPGQAHRAKTLAKMKLSTTSPWTNGSFTLATASHLSHRRLKVKAGDSLEILVHYQGGATREISYMVH